MECQNHFPRLKCFASQFKTRTCKQISKYSSLYMSFSPVGIKRRSNSTDQRLSVHSIFRWASFVQLWRLFFSAAMESRRRTPCVQVSCSLWFLHSNSTTPRVAVFNPKYRRCSPSSNKCLPGHGLTSLHTSNTTSATRKDKKITPLD